MQNEIWKTIDGYENYQVSNLGNVKSLPRHVNCNGGIKFIKERFLKPGLSKGYKNVILYKELKSKSFKVHKLVAMTFLNHVPCGYKLVVDHINDIKTDNRVENLQIVTQRENSYKTQGRYSSKYKGVFYYKTRNKWVSKIYVNGKQNFLGYFTSEVEASNAYKIAINKIK